MARRALVPAVLVALTAFALYHATLLPGFDFGDTGSFQATVGSTLITNRDAYPLYFAIGDALLWTTGAEPAHALNLASAIEGAMACGLFVFVAAELSGSVAAGAASALLFAVSYTFWSQAIIAEVYSLHMLFVLLTLWLLLRWAERPTSGRLAWFFAMYALGFGNHLSMVLLLPGYTLFLLASAPGGWRSMFAPRIVLLATMCAVAGALQYAWNMHSMWVLPQPPHGLADALARFWFDVTKSDWRDTMVMNVPQSLLRDHLAMYWFDLRQQFGVVGPALAVIGLGHLAMDRRPEGLRHDGWRRAVLMALLFAVNVTFAFTYNVGDSHVFYLPSHLIVALLTAPALTVLGRLKPATTDTTPAAVSGFSRTGGLPKGRHYIRAASALLAIYASTRAYHDFPALDRSRDRRPAEVLGALTAGLGEHDVLLTDLNWQIENGLSYFAKYRQPPLAKDRAADVLLYAPAYVAAQHADGRSVLVTERARATLSAAYGPLLPTDQDPRVVVPRLSDIARSLPPGTRYVMCVLRPSRDLALDADEVRRTLSALTGGAGVVIPNGDYAAVAGITGLPPRLVTADPRPFRAHVDLGGADVEIRMESWLASDTIRRMGFGQIVAHRQHTLIVERGVSLAAFDGDGRPIATAYASNIFAPQPRYLIGAK